MIERAAWLSIALWAVGCAGSHRAHVAPSTKSSAVAEADSNDKTQNPSPGDAGKSESAPLALYPLADAITDATSSPLQFVGMGPWPGNYLTMACLYQNEEVLVVRNLCLPAMREQMRVMVVHPKRGSANFFVQAQKKGLVTRLRREEYTDVQVASTPAPSGPPLTLNVSYEQFIAHIENNANRRGTCIKRLDQAEAKCYGEAEPLVDAFAPDAQAFEKNPPEPWYTLAKTLSDWDRKAKPTHLPDTADNRRFAAAVFARALGLDVNYEKLDGPGAEPTAFSAMMLLDNGHVVVGGSQQRRHAVVAVIAELNELGQPVWKTTLTSRGFNEHSAPMVARTPDGGYAALIRAGKKDIINATITQIAKLDAKGRQQWLWKSKARFLGRSGDVTPEGAFRIAGHHNPRDGGDSVPWTAEISPRGKLVEQRVGE